LHSSEIRRVPLDCHCNSGVNSQYRRGIEGYTPVLRSKRESEVFPLEASVMARTLPLLAGSRETGAGKALMERVTFWLARSYLTRYPLGYAIDPWIATVIQGYTASIEGVHT
jgi:hypothetical protein